MPKYYFTSYGYHRVGYRTTSYMCGMWVVPRTTSTNVTARYSEGAVHLCEWREPGVNVHVDVGVGLVFFTPLPPSAKISMGT